MVDLGSFTLVWFWVFACLIIPCFMLISAFALLQFRNILILIMDISTKSVPGWLKPMLLTVKTALSESYVPLHFRGANNERNTDHCSASATRASSR